MTRILMAAALFLAASASVTGQNYFTRNGYVRFFSATPIENIEAINNQVSCIVNFETGEVVSKLLMEAFRFEKALMQEHFNENYVESDKFPQGVLKATIMNLKDIDLSKPGKHEVTLNADLTIHGVSKKRQISGTIEKVNDRIITLATFVVLPADHDIKIPKVVANNIAREIEVSVKFELEPLKK